MCMRESIMYESNSSRFYMRRALAGFEIPLEIQSFLSLVYENKCHGAISEKAT